MDYYDLIGGIRVVPDGTTTSPWFSLQVTRAMGPGYVIQRETALGPLPRSSVCACGAYQLSFSWGVVDQIDYRSHNIAVQNRGTSVEIQIPDRRVFFYPEKRLGSDNQYTHLSWAEKTLSQPFLSMADRTLLQGYFVFDSKTKNRMLPGVLIYHGTEPPSIYRPRPK